MQKTKLLTLMTITLLYVLVAYSSAFAQPPAQTYKFGQYSVKTGYTAKGPSIEVLKQKKRIYYACGGDSYGDTRLDTLTLNNDSLPDFVYCELNEEYTSVCLLASNTRPPLYTFYCLGNYFAPIDYDKTVVLRKGDKIETYIIQDVNKDGKKDILFNVLKRNGKYYPIKNWTDTFDHAYIRDIANGRPHTPNSRAILLGREQNNIMTPTLQR